MTTTAATVADIGVMITSKPGIHGGRPIIAGTGVTVQRIAVWHNLGNAPEEIVQKISHLSLAQIHAALSYYYANQEWFDADIAAEDEAYERYREEYHRERQSQP